VQEDASFLAGRLDLAVMRTVEDDGMLQRRGILGGRIAEVRRQLPAEVLTEDCTGLGSDLTQGTALRHALKFLLIHRFARFRDPFDTCRVRCADH